MGEITPEEKVEDLKKRIATLKPEFPADLQKLLHAGKILADGSSVSEYGIKPGGFIVMMVSKPSQPKAAAPAPVANVAPSPTPAPQPPVANNNESTVLQLCEMGFPREEVEKCLRAAFNNADRAVEYLTTGIPESRARSRSPPPSSGHQGGHGNGGHGHGGHGGHSEQEHGHSCDGENCTGHGHDDGHSHGHGHGHGHAPAETMDPVQAMLAAAQAAQGHGTGHLSDEGHDNSEQGHGHGDDPVATMLAALGGEGNIGEEDGMDEGDAVTLSEAEQEAISRLTALGFSQEQALEAYLVCDRKEEIAANYLFDRA